MPLESLFIKEVICKAVLVILESHILHVLLSFEITIFTENGMFNAINWGAGYEEPPFRVALSKIM
jgi:hypothetical protein